MVAGAEGEAMVTPPEDEEGGNDEDALEGAAEMEKGEKINKKKKKGGKPASTPAGAKSAGQSWEQYSTLWVRKLHSV